MPKQRRHETTSQRYCAILLTALCGCAVADADGEALDPLAQAAQTAELDAGALDAGAPDGGSSDGGTRDAGPPPPPPNAIQLTDETGATVAEIIASGRGCPRGSWGAEMNADGLAFTATFTKLNIALSSTAAFSSSSCLLTILPPRWEARQFAAQTITYATQADLEEGVVGALELRHYYQGIGSNAEPGHVYEEGPYAGTLGMTREVSGRNVRWTPCGARRRGVNIDVQLRLNNTLPRAGGSLQGDLDEGTSKLVVQLMSRACPVTDAGTPPR